MRFKESYIYRFVKCYGFKVNPIKFKEVERIEKMLEIFEFEKIKDIRFEELIKQRKELIYDLYIEIPHRFPIGSGG